jgi:hypothetical protein
MRVTLSALALFSLVSVAANAATISFVSDPFLGSTALTTPGRQVVGGEPSITFVPGVDVFAFALAAFGPYGIGPTLDFASDIAANLPTSGLEAVVLRSFDDDANPATAFGAGNAANLIAARVTSPGAGFFIYFNSGLDLARLVFSTDLNDNQADLKILARLTNLSGAAGQSAMANFRPANFTTVPEPASVLLTTFGALWLLRRRRGGHR